MNETKVFRWLKLAWFARVAVLLVASFLPYDQPHVWRQVDTASVAIRYFNRWALESGPAGELPFFLPGVLNAGDNMGIVKVEFPLLNLVMAPAYAAGPLWGRVAAQWIVIALCVLLSLACIRAWKDARIGSLQVEKALWLLPLLSPVGAYFGKIIPDPVSVLLAFAGVGVAWRGGGPRRGLLAFVLFGLGVLIKPPSVLVGALLLVHPDLRRRFLSFCAWGVPACLLALFYYTKGLAWLGTFQDSHEVFGVGIREPLAMLVEWFSKPLRIGEVLLSVLTFTGGGALLALGAWGKGTNLRKDTEGRLLLVLGVQLLGLAALDGEHSFVHKYYYMSLGPVSCMLFWALVVETRRRWITLLAFVALAAYHVEFSYMTLRTLRPSKLSAYSPPFFECSALRERNPGWPWRTGFALRAPESEKLFPSLGVCMGEKTMSNTSPYGVFWKDKGPAEGCRVVDEGRWVVLARCE